MRSGACVTPDLIGRSEHHAALRSPIEGRIVQPVKRIGAHVRARAERDRGPCWVTLTRATSATEDLCDGEPCEATRFETERQLPFCQRRPDSHSLRSTP